MAVYFDHHCQAPFPGQNTDLQWHRTHPILAVASFSESSGATLTLYQEEVLIIIILSLMRDFVQLSEISYTYSHNTCNACTTLH